MSVLTLALDKEHADKTKEEISLLLDQEIDTFSNFMANIGDWKSVGALSNAERALIKTYLVQKLTGKLEGSK